jgi:hypothetical protein
VYIDPERIKAINDFNPPTSKMGVQYFFKKIKKNSKICSQLYYHCQAYKEVAKKGSKV